MTVFHSDVQHAANSQSNTPGSATILEPTQGRLLVVESNSPDKENVNPKTEERRKNMKKSISFYRPRKGSITPRFDFSLAAYADDYFY